MLTAKNVWLFSIGLILAITTSVFIYLWSADLHFAQKIIFVFLWKIAFVLTALCGFLFLIKKAGLKNILNLIYLILVAGLFIGGTWLLGFAGDHKLPSALAAVKSKEIMTQGWDKFHQQDFTGALALFDKALEVDSNSAAAYFGKAYVYSVQQKLDLAILNYNKSIELDPAHADSYGNLGLSYLYENKLDEALASLQKAEQLEPNNSDVQVNLAVYYFQIKNYSKAWEKIHIAKKLNGNINPMFLKDLRTKMAEPIN